MKTEVESQASLEACWQRVAERAYRKSRGEQELRVSASWKLNPPGRGVWMNAAAFRAVWQMSHNGVLWRLRMAVALNLAERRKVTIMGRRGRNWHYEWRFR